MKTLVLILLLAAAGCGDDECGPGDAPVDGVTVAIAGGTTITYGSFTSSPNNDCTTGAETSLTIEGVQVDPQPVGAIVPKIALCIPMPDAVGGDPMELGLDDTAPVRLVDINASVDPCTYSLDFATDPTGTIAFAGYCGNGTDGAGYAITLAGTASVREVCGTDIDMLSADLNGAAAVTALNP